MTAPAWQVAVVGAGPVGLALALHAARLLPRARLTLYDARAAAVDPVADARTLALSLGSVRFLQQLGVWPRDGLGEPIDEVHVSQSVPGLLTPWAAGSGRAGGAAAAPAVWLRAAELGVPQLGAVVGYGELLAPLQRAWDAAAADEPQRLQARFDTPVTALKALAGGVEIDAGIAERMDLVVVAEGAAGTAASGRALSGGDRPERMLARDYGQSAWVGTATLRPGARRGRAVERFTPDGPLALLPLPPGGDGVPRAAVVWCVDRAADPLPALSEAQRVALINDRLPREAGEVVALSGLRPFALALNARRTLVHGRQVCIGNAAQTLHPVAGQGLNLGLRDAHALVSALRFAGDLDAALRRVEWARLPDRWSLIAATDFLARAFTWQFPGAAAARGLGLAALQAAPPLKAVLARRMMFGRR